ncbi:Uncharacterised protein [Vibrio cholerae]|nr:Uncharacterised protein [Vibrio cholerae]
MRVIAIHHRHLAQTGCAVIHTFLNVKVNQCIKAIIKVGAAIGTVPPHFAHHPKRLTALIIVFTPRCKAFRRALF